MQEIDFIQKLKESDLLGRGGAAFPTWQKWQAVKQTRANKKYIICNGAEGEPGVFKDEFILRKYPREVINGIRIAMSYLGKSEAILFLNSKYYRKFRKKLSELTKTLPITLFEKSHGYIAGEESALLNQIEGKRTEPRNKPPFPTESGLDGLPTLINNVETFYYISKIAKGEYKKTTFYSISGEVKNRGVFELPLALTIKEVLEKTKNYPKFSFFAQIGGWACGEIFLANELNKPFSGCASIIIYDYKKTKLTKLLKDWAVFYSDGNCDKCAPCREGTARLAELASQKQIDFGAIDDILLALEKTSFCSLGRGIVKPYRSLILKLKLDGKN